MTHPTPTRRLHRDEPLRLTFEGSVVAHAPWQGRPAVVLDQTAFYPESGGQNADHGHLGEARVVDVQVDDAGVVHHLLEGPLPAPGARVEGQVDEARRRLHMALHTGQHLLSQAFLAQAGAATVSAHLGEVACTVDVRTASLPPAALRAAEAQVNDLIDADLPVTIRYPDPEALAALPLRRSPKVSIDVRVVCIGDLDLTPCGGTHTPHTSLVGVLAILSAEHYKGLTRVTFDAGARARRRLVARSAVLAELGRGFSCQPRQVGDAVEALRARLAAAEGRLRAQRRHLAEALALELLGRSPGEGPVVATLGDLPPQEHAAFADAELLRAVGAVISARSGRAVALAATGPEGLQVFLARGQDAAIHCGALMKALSTATGGRGGGPADHAEGRLPPGTDFPALVSAHWPGPR